MISNCAFLLIYPLDCQNTKKLKTKMLSFYKQQSYFSKIVSKNAKITILFFYEKQQKIWNLVFSFMYLVSVYPTDRTIKSENSIANCEK